MDPTWVSFRVVDASVRVTGRSLRTGPISEGGDRPAASAAVAGDGRAVRLSVRRPAQRVTFAPARQERDGMKCVRIAINVPPFGVERAVIRPFEQAAQYGATRDRGQGEFSPSAET